MRRLARSLGLIVAVVVSACGTNPGSPSPHLGGKLPAATSCGVPPAYVAAQTVPQTPDHSTATIRPTWSASTSTSASASAVALEAISVSPEAAAGGVIALVEDGDNITIDIPARSIRLDVPEGELASRRTKIESNGGYHPRTRQRPVSAALRAYAAMATSADKGAVRDVSKLEN